MLVAMSTPKMQLQIRTISIMKKKSTIRCTYSFASLIDGANDS